MPPKSLLTQMIAESQSAEQRGFAKSIISQAKELSEQLKLCGFSEENLRVFLENLPIDTPEHISLSQFKYQIAAKFVSLQQLEANEKNELFGNIMTSAWNLEQRLALEMIFEVNKETPLDLPRCLNKVSMMVDGVFYEKELYLPQRPGNREYTSGDGSPSTQSAFSDSESDVHEAAEGEGYDNFGLGTNFF